MQAALIILGMAMGMAIILATVAAIIMTHMRWRKQAKFDKSASRLEIAGRQLASWSLFDYAVLMLFAVGLMLLTADVIGMIRDQVLYPPYHYKYVLLGVVFLVSSMFILIIRLAILLRYMRLLKK